MLSIHLIEPFRHRHAKAMHEDDASRDAKIPHFRHFKFPIVNDVLKTSFHPDFGEIDFSDVHPELRRSMCFTLT